MRKTKHKNTGIRLIKKANKLVESRYKFDIWETRVFLTVLAQINKNDLDFQVYRIYYKDIIRAFDLRSAQSYSFLRDAARGLMRKVFYVTNYSEGQRRETEYHIVRTVDYLAEGEKGGDNHEYIDITIDPEMKPLLLQLGNNYKGEKGENFTSYELRNVTKLGAYHVRIYELLKQYQKIGHRKLLVEDIKRMLEITTEYPLFGNFFQKVVKPSVKSINKNTDLNITKLEKIKEGRRVVALYFEFRMKDKEEVQEIWMKNSGARRKAKRKTAVKKKVATAEKKDQLFDRFHEVVVQQFGVTPSVFLRLLDQVTEVEVEQAIRVTRRMKANNEISKNVAGFFVKALKEGYTDPKEEARKKKALQEDQLRMIQLEVNALEKERDEKINNEIRRVVEAQPDITQRAIDKLRSNPFTLKNLKAKEVELGRALVLEDYRKDVRLREMVKMNIVELAKDRFVDILESHSKSVREVRRRKV